jgi:hypothetical protein
MLRKFFARRSARKYAERHKRLHVETDSVLQEDALADLAEQAKQEQEKALGSVDHSND